MQKGESQERESRLKVNHMYERGAPSFNASDEIPTLKQPGAGTQRTAGI